MRKSTPNPPPGRGRALLSAAEWTRVRLALTLSPREIQIVQCVCDDMKEICIAHELGISVHTVHTHLDRIYRKLDVDSRCSLVVRVFGEFLRQPRRVGRAARGTVG